MKRPLTSRADLLRAVANDDPTLSMAMAALLGYEYEDINVVRESPSFPAPREETPHPDEWTTTYQPADVLFWRVEEFTAVDSVAPPPRPTRAFGELKWRNRPEAPGFTPLATSREVLTTLRKTDATRRAAPDVDVEAVVERISQGHFLQQLPHRHRRAWGASITVVVDRARRLVPYWLDQEYLLVALENLYPPHGLTIAHLGDGDSQPARLWPDEQRGYLIDPPSGTLVVVLGDLGCLARQGEHARHFWWQWGRQLRARGNPAVALVPAQVTEIPPDLAQTWTIVRWGTTALVETGTSRQAKAETVRQVLTLLSPAVRIEPGLVRAVRGLLPEGRGDPGLEASVWQDVALASQHSVAASWDRDQRRAYQQRFAELPESLRKLVLDVICSWRAPLHQAVWFEEIVELDEQSQREGIDPADLEDAKTYFTVCAETVRRSARVSVDVKAWIARLTERYTAKKNADPPIQHALHRLYEVIRPRCATAPVPEWYDPAFVERGDEDREPTVRQVVVWQVGDQLRVATIGESSPADLDSAVQGSPLGMVHTGNGRVTIAVGESGLEKKREFDLNLQPRSSTLIPQDAAFHINTDRDRMRFGVVTLPECKWAKEMGRDAYGLWAEFVVGEVRQRMRWISPGRFWIGSPEDEEGRYKDEGPRHEVRLAHGFWLFDTPCTQALWQAVMGKNPSGLKGQAGKGRPVEQVRWEDCQAFLFALNTQLPGAALALPTEAEWEYACRAGTDAPRYAADLDAIAWYSKNSNYRTHEVKLKQPNAWGLYDMLGNVDEWCHDGSRRYEAKVATDPLGPIDAGAVRAIRGGGWGDGARVVRAACRFAGVPGFRYQFVGFRCASSSQVSRPVSFVSPGDVRARVSETAATDGGR